MNNDTNEKQIFLLLGLKVFTSQLKFNRKKSPGRGATCNQGSLGLCDNKTFIKSLSNSVQQKGVNIFGRKNFDSKKSTLEFSVVCPTGRTRKVCQALIPTILFACLLSGLTGCFEYAFRTKLVLPDGCSNTACHKLHRSQWKF